MAIECIKNQHIKFAEYCVNLLGPLHPQTQNLAQAAASYGKLDALKYFINKFPAGQCPYHLLAIAAAKGGQQANMEYCLDKIDEDKRDYKALLLGAIEGDHSTIIGWILNKIPAEKRDYLVYARKAFDANKLASTQDYLRNVDMKTRELTAGRLLVAEDATESDKNFARLLIAKFEPTGVPVNPNQIQSMPKPKPANLGMPKPTPTNIEASIATLNNLRVRKPTPANLGIPKPSLGMPIPAPGSLGMPKPSLSMPIPAPGSLGIPKPSLSMPIPAPGSLGMPKPSLSMPIPAPGSLGMPKPSLSMPIPAPGSLGIPKLNLSMPIPAPGSLGMPKPALGNLGFPRPILDILGQIPADKALPQSTGRRTPVPPMMQPPKVNPMPFGSSNQLPLTNPIVALPALSASAEIEVEDEKADPRPTDLPNQPPLNNPMVALPILQRKKNDVELDEKSAANASKNVQAKSKKESLPKTVKKRTHEIAFNNKSEEKETKPKKKKPRRDPLSSTLVVAKEMEGKLYLGDRKAKLTAKETMEELIKNIENSRSNSIPRSTKLRKDRISEEFEVDDEMDVVDEIYATANGTNLLFQFSSKAAPVQEKNSSPSSAESVEQDEKGNQQKPKQ
jgi:hypothetical protein